MQILSAEAAYRGSTRSTASPKTVERKLLEEHASRIESTQQEKDLNFPAFAKALHENLRLWLVFGTEAARNDNPMDPTLRAQLFTLSDFVRAHTSKVLNGNATVDVLVEINRNIAAGLRGQAPDPVAA